MSPTPATPTSSSLEELSVNGWNAEFVDELYQQWVNDPDSVEPQWRHFFHGFDLGYRVPEEEAGEDGAAGLPPAKVQVARALVQLRYRWRNDDGGE